MSSCTLVQNGRSAATIVTSRRAGETVRYAANELHRFLYRCVGSPAAVMSDISPSRQPEVRIGPDVRDDPFYAELDLSGLGDEGYRIFTRGEDLYILGATPRGTLYGVYAFLERFLGVRMYAPGVTVTPRCTGLTVTDIDITGKPAFEYRDAYWGCAFDGEFCAFNRLNSAKAVISEEQGGKMRFFNFHHACLDLVPEAKYFAEHPEYYAERNGVRTPAQLCLSNPDTRRIAARTLRGWIRGNPHTRVFSVAQNDNQEYCTCEKCRALDEREGNGGVPAPSASIIDFANFLADDIRDDYPDVLLHTFAYQYSVVPPKTLRPRKNVIVRLCNIGADFAHPYGESEAHDAPTREFTESLRRWNGLAGRLYVWDYCTDFSHYLLPFPNLHCLQPNMRLYRDNGVKGVFLEGDFSHGCAAFFCELQAYLQAKLLWDPDADVEAETDGFLNAFYGKGAPYIRRYIALLTGRAAAVERMGLYVQPENPVYSDEFAAEGVSLFEQALAAEPDETVRRRIDRTKLGADYLYLVRLPMDAPGRDAAFDAFAERLRLHGVTEITERGALEPAIEGLKTARYGKGMRAGGHYYHMYYRM